ncbi:transcriptional regulator [Clostridia bacterium]|nr:transcriptional regulator [Clostridia bacterium]
MKEFLTALKSCPLFAGVGADDLGTMLGCLSPQKRKVGKDEYIFAAEDKVRSVGVVLSGSVHIIREDYWGRRTILARAECGDIFAEAFACAGTQKLPVSVVADEESLVMLFDYTRIVRSCGNACVFHTRLIQNMLEVVARKNVSLTEKMQHLTQRTTQEKLLSYFSEQARRHGSDEFDIPFDRQELADYLSVERSAMAYELSQLRNKGLLACRKNHVKLFQKAECGDSLF